MQSNSMNLPDKDKLKKEYYQNLPMYKAILHDVQSRVNLILKENSLHLTIKQRVKSFESMYQKYLLRLRQGNTPQTVHIADLIGIRIVCPFLEDVTCTERILKNNFKIVEEERKGQENSFREFGYESIHFIAEIPNEEYVSFGNTRNVCEIQIRTILQDAWAEVEHELVYKNEFIPFDSPLKRKLAALNANLTLSDTIFQEIRDYQRELNSELKKRSENFNQHLSSMNNGIADSLASFYRSIKGYTLGASIDDLLIAALHLHNKNQYSEAIAVYSKILAKEPEEKVRAITYVHRGMAYFADNDYTQALEDFSRAIECDDSLYQAFMYRGISFRLLNKEAQSISDLTKCIDLDPYYPDAFIERGKSYHQIGKRAEAEIDFATARKLDPENKKLSEVPED